MKPKPVLDPIDYYHTHYGDDADDLGLSNDILYKNEDPLSFLHPLDEDNSFVKLGDFWPHRKNQAA